VSGLIDRAARRGLVRRDTSSDDARAVRVSLTPDGKRLAKVLTDEVGDLITPMTGGLSTGDQKRLSALLDRLLPGRDAQIPVVGVWGAASMIGGVVHTRSTTSRRKAERNPASAVRNLPYGFTPTIEAARKAGYQCV